MHRRHYDEDDYSSESCLDGLDMQLIGNFLSFASRGDRVGLNKMLREGINPNVQDYDKRTALHLAASEGHAPIVELLLAYKANPLTDAKEYGHQDICRILEVNGGKESDAHPMAVRREDDSVENIIDISELNLQNSTTFDQGLFGESKKVKWRGTWVAKTQIRKQDNTLLRELRHPNILQFLGSIVQGEEMSLITEYLPKGNLYDILKTKIRLDPITTLRYALHIARGMNYLHQHKPFPIVHNNLHTKNLLLDEGGHLKIGEYWVQMLYNQRNTNQDSCKLAHPKLCSMLEGKFNDKSKYERKQLKAIDLQKKFYVGRCPGRILQMIENCTSKDPSQRPDFASVIRILEEVSVTSKTAGCPPCIKNKNTEHNMSFATKPQESRGLIFVTLAQDPEYHVSQIATAVVVAKYLGATLVIPNIKQSASGQKRLFGEIYDTEKFTATLKEKVPTLQAMDAQFAEISNQKVTTVRVPNMVSKEFVKSKIEPIFKTSRNLRLSIFFPSSMKHKRMNPYGCLATFDNSLMLKPELQASMDSMVGTLRSLNPRSHGRFVSVQTMPGSGFDAKEIASFMKKIGFENETTVYLTLNGWDTSIIENFRNIFPNTFTKDVIIPADEKTKFLDPGRPELKQIIDFYISSAADVYIPTSSNLFSDNVIASRIGTAKQQVALVHTNRSSLSAEDYIPPSISQKGHWAYSCFCL
nr:serine/threonine-protein kinase CTR1-like isoform X1 [Ipomoea batatas]